jgi:branched-chain amino acid transport system substrate-binding protein
LCQKARKAASPPARRISRRAILKTGLAGAASAVWAPFPIRARTEQPVKIGMVEPLTGVFRQLAEAEIAGARLAIEEINQSGGILGREAQLLVSDSANDVMTGVEQTRQLIDKDQVDFITGNVNSAVALAMTRVTAEKRKLHIVTGGHTDEITGSQCSWNVFRVCKSTTMEANAIAEVLIGKFGARWYFLTPDYVYGHALQEAFERKLREHGGRWAADFLPVGTVDYSDALTNAAAFRPNVMIDLMGGDDQVNSLKQIVSFGLAHDMAVGGALFELESILSVPAEARVGWWTMEWWWNQPDVPGIKHSTPPSAAAPARPRARAVGSAMPGSARLRRSPIRRSRSMPWCSPARWRDTHCPRISRSIPIAHLSARPITNS